MSKMDDFKYEIEKHLRETFMDNYTNNYNSNSNIDIDSASMLDENKDLELEMIDLYYNIFVEDDGQMPTSDIMDIVYKITDFNDVNSNIQEDIQDYELYRKDPHGYYGVSPDDFM